MSLVKGSCISRNAVDAMAFLTILFIIGVVADPISNRAIMLRRVPQRNTRMGNHRNKFPFEINTPERPSFCTHPANRRNCVLVNEQFANATLEAKQKFPDIQKKGDFGAFRQCYFAARMSIALGQRRAKEFATRHQEENQSAVVAEMNQRNNAIGLKVGGWANDFEGAAKVCACFAKSGELLIIHKKTLVPSGTSSTKFIISDISTSTQISTINFPATFTNKLNSSV